MGSSQGQPGARHSETPSPRRYKPPGPQVSATSVPSSTLRFLCHDLFLPFLFKNHLCIFLERREGREKERERNIYVREKHQLVASRVHPDWGPNWRTFALQNDTQPTEPCRSGQFLTVLVLFYWFSFHVSVFKSSRNYVGRNSSTQGEAKQVCHCLYGK